MWKNATVARKKLPFRKAETLSRSLLEVGGHVRCPAGLKEREGGLQQRDSKKGGGGGGEQMLYCPNNINNDFQINNRNCNKKISPNTTPLPASPLH